MRQSTDVPSTPGTRDEIPLAVTGDPAQHEPGESPADAGQVISTRRMACIISGLWVSLFLSATETTIVATSLRRMSVDLDGLSQDSWVIVAYLLTYNGFLLLFSKLSDTFGQKSLLILAQLIFLVFSIACGAAKTMTQLIVFRAMQGIGGSGIYSLVFVTLAKIATVDKIGFYSGILSSVFALASLVGPILGGYIVDTTTWRWVFYLNGPGIALSLLFIIPAMPPLKGKLMDSEKMRRIDLVGAVLSLAWPTMLVFALQEGGQDYAWDSSVIIRTLIASGVGLVTFMCYEGYVQRSPKVDPIFPLRLLKHPIISLTMVSMFSMGACFYAATILLPQRFQAVNGLSAAKSGLFLLPFTIVSPFFSMICGYTMGKKEKTAGYFPVAGSALVVAAIGLLSTLPSHLSVSGAQYGYEVVIGVGLGILMPPMVLFIKFECHDDDLAAAMGMSNTVRTMGGCIALAICSTILNSDLHSKLPTFLTKEQIETFLQTSSSISSLLPEAATKVRIVYAQSYNLQFKSLLSFAGVTFLACIGLMVVTRRRTSNT